MKTELLKCGNATVGPAIVVSCIGNRVEANEEAAAGLKPRVVDRPKGSAKVRDGLVCDRGRMNLRWLVGSRVGRRAEWRWRDAGSE